MRQGEMKCSGCLKPNQWYFPRELSYTLEATTITTKGGLV